MNQLPIESMGRLQDLLSINRIYSLCVFGQLSHEPALYGGLSYHIDLSLQSSHSCCRVIDARRVECCSSGYRHSEFSAGCRVLYMDECRLRGPYPLRIAA